LAILLKQDSILIAGRFLL